jgi:putative transposase
MSGKGNCYDNAVAESFFSSLKNEIVHHRNYQRKTRHERRFLSTLNCFTIVNEYISR